MRPDIGGKGHLGIDGVHNTLQSLLLFLLVILIPDVKVQPFSAVSDMPFDLKRDRGNVGIPGPMGGVGVAVITGAPEQSSNLWGRGDLVCCCCLRCFGYIDLDQLQQ